MEVSTPYSFHLIAAADVLGYDGNCEYFPP
jgi:hypothetical protein